MRPYCQGVHKNKIAFEWKERKHWHQIRQHLFLNLAHYGKQQHALYCMYIRRARLVPGMYLYIYVDTWNRNGYFGEKKRCKIEALNATVLPRAEKLAITEMYVGKIEALNATVLPRGTQKQNCVWMKRKKTLASDSSATSFWESGSLWQTAACSLLYVYT